MSAHKSYVPQSGGWDGIGTTEKPWEEGHFKEISAGLISDSFGQNDITPIDLTSAAIQVALNEAAATGATVVLRAATYAITSKIVFPPNTRLVGKSAGSGAHNRNAAIPDQLLKSTTLLITEGAGTTDEEAQATFTLNDNCEMRNVTFYYPNIDRLVVPPTQHPFAIRFAVQTSANKGAGLLEDVQFINAPRGVDIQFGRVTLNRVTGQCLYKGIRVDNSWDCVRISNCQFGPWWSSDFSGPQAVMSDWMRGNFIAIDLYRCDQIMLTSSFVFNAKIGLRLNPVGNPAPVDSGPYGSLQPYGSAIQCGFDWCNTSVLINGCTDFAPFTFSDCTFVCGPRYGSDQLVNIHVTYLASGMPRFIGCHSWGACDRIMLHEGFCDVTIENCDFHNAPSQIPFIVQGAGLVRMYNNTYLLGVNPPGGIYIDHLYPGGFGTIIEPTLSRVNWQNTGLASVRWMFAEGVDAAGGTFRNSFGAVAPININIEPSTHVTSNRAAIGLNKWLLLQDTALDGTTDFGIYNQNVGTSAFALKINNVRNTTAILAVDYANNAAAIAAGLQPGEIYRTNTDLKIVVAP